MKSVNLSRHGNPKCTMHLIIVCPYTRGNRDGAESINVRTYGIPLSSADWGRRPWGYRRPEWQYQLAWPKRHHRIFYPQTKHKLSSQIHSSYFLCLKISLINLKFLGHKKNLFSISTEINWKLTPEKYLGNLQVFGIQATPLNGSKRNSQGRRGNIVLEKYRIKWKEGLGKGG